MQRECEGRERVNGSHVVHQYDLQGNTKQQVVRGRLARGKVSRASEGEDREKNGEKGQAGTGCMLNKEEERSRPGC